MINFKDATNLELEQIVKNYEERIFKMMIITEEEEVEYQFALQELQSRK